MPEVVSLSDAIVHFERRMRASPTLREALGFAEYTELVRAIVREREEVIRLMIELEKLKK